MSDKNLRSPSVIHENTTRELLSIRHALDVAAIVAITDPKGIIIHVNDKFCQISKFNRNELIGKNHRIINSGHHPADFFTNMWKTISNGYYWEGEVKNRAKDGTYYWVHTTIVPLLDENRRPFQYVSIRFDITQRKITEEKLNIYADKLESSNRELQDFASIAAHDLQEPLRKILTFGDRLKTKCVDQLPNDAKDYLERMLSAASRMRILIEDLLSYSSVQSKPKEFTTVDLNQVLADVISDLEIRIEQTNAKFTIEALPIIQADASQMRQLFQNVIGNSLKFLKVGVHPEIVIKSAVIDKKAKISIEDNGIGFDEKYLDRIFTIFQRLHSRSEYEGTGVGLAVVRRIAERHGGSISAESRQNIGSTFHIHLPIQQEKE